MIHEDEEVLAINKPGDVVCHPSKAGPWSSLAGAVREYTALPSAHLVFRLDRETSGVVVFAKSAGAAGRFQTAMERRQAVKTYLAVLEGRLTAPVTVDQPLGDDACSRVLAKMTVRPDGKPSLTTFVPLSGGGGFTLCRISTGTGRKHQIRAHAQWLGNPVAGDKIYGPDEGLFLDFIENGWSGTLAEKLPLPRQALHCFSVDLTGAGAAGIFYAPLPEDMLEFCSSRGIHVPGEFTGGT